MYNFYGSMLWKDRSGTIMSLFATRLPSIQQNRKAKSKSITFLLAHSMLSNLINHAFFMEFVLSHPFAILEPRDPSIDKLYEL